MVSQKIEDMEVEQLEDIGHGGDVEGANYYCQFRCANWIYTGPC